MTNLPSQHPAISMHLTDVSLTPLISSSRSQSHLESLTALSNTALASQTACQRVKLGAPERIMVEYPDRGPVILQSFLDPAAVRVPTQRHERSRPPTAKDEGSANGGSQKAGEWEAEVGEVDDRPASSDGDLQAEDAPPALVSIVVAGSADQAREARKAAAKLERVGRDFQREWASENS
ncbi:unnamed protein product [Clonostachys rosea f. rosea IK726]|uniref:Uncharacterized protein n=2 Tax=Bionectria ochroleuca TaxID=29856 RepID=A0A0B7K7B6_BIOOC|nr:unnamed protein product [Clonostachys rosea f. rosea IK726]